MIKSREENKLSDEELMAMARNGDEGAFEEIVERFQKPLIAFLHGITGEFETARDLAQDTFFKLWRYRLSYDPARRFRVWLFTIARRTALNHIDKFKPEPDSKAADSASSPSPNPESDAEAENLGSILLGLVRNLPPKQQVTFILRAMEGHSVREVSIIMGSSEASVLTNLFDARKSLMKDIENLHPELIGEGAMR